MKFAPEGINIFLLVVDPGKLHHMEPGCRMSAIGADQQVESNRYLCGSCLLSLNRYVLGGVLSMVRRRKCLLFEPSDVLFEVCPCQLMIEIESDIRHLF